MAAHRGHVCDRSARRSALHRAPLAAVCLAGAMFAEAAHAQQVNVQRYDVRDGLAHDMVTSVREDSRGYLWVATFEGLSRFDGYGFTTFTTAHGLGNYVLNDLAEDRQGRLWVATNGGGVSRLEDRPIASGHPFATFVPGPGGAANVNVLAVAPDGRLWCGTDAGAYVADISGDVPVFSHLGFADSGVFAIAADEDRVWMGASRAGLVEVHARGTVVHPVPWSTQRTRSLVIEGPRRLLVASDAGVFRFDDGKWTRTQVDLRPGEIVLHLLGDGSGGVWLATTEGLAHYSASGTQRYPLDRGLMRLALDGSGNLWAAVRRGGIAAMKPRQIVSYTPGEGLPNADATALLRARNGEVLAISRPGAVTTFRDGEVKTWPGPPSPGGHRRLVPDGRGSWFGLGADGLYHVPGTIPMPAGARRLPLPIEPSAAIPSAMALMEIDRSGNLWVGSLEPALWRVSNPGSDDQQVRMWRLDLPPGEALSVLGIDPSGAVWLGNMTRLARFAGGQLTVVPPPAGLPQIQPRAFFVDRAGNVWIGLRFGGVMMTRNPAARQPAFVRYGTAEGLASDSVWAIAEGPSDGMIYLGTGRGLDQLDPSTGRVRHLSTADGLAANIINDLLVDGRDALWLAGAGGVSRLTLPLPTGGEAPAPVYITRLQRAGVDHPLPVRGASVVDDVELEAHASHLRIEFLTPSFRHTGRIRYQYRLEGVDPSWSSPSEARSATYVNLAPGRYRFLARAVSAGELSDSPAAVEFVIHPPYYARRSFLAALILGVTALGLVVQRVRLHRRRSMDAIRRQVATDLHDDVGSGLAQIAILSEVVKRDVPGAAAPTLSTIADLARALRETMSDIVWAIDPDRDVPVALVQRMRQVAFNLLSPSTNVEFRAPDDRELTQLDMPPDRRRHLLLIFKEALTNVARHAGASEVAISITVPLDRLILTVRDNGIGFDPADSHGGHGLESVKHRARSIGAELSVDSSPGRGTLLTVVVPLRRRTRMFGWLRRRPSRA